MPLNKNFLVDYSPVGCVIHSGCIYVIYEDNKKILKIGSVIQL